MPRYLLNLSILLFLVPAACSEPEVPTGQPVSFGDQPTPSSEGELSFSVPEGWIQESPSSAMRKAQFRLPGDNGEDAELAIFAGIGGTVQQNVDRWINQFSRPDGTSVKDAAKISTQQINGMATTIVDVSGNFKSGGMMPMAGAVEAMENYRMLAAVIEAPSGPWFLKLTGPRETVERWEKSFNQYLATAEMK